MRLDYEVVPLDTTQEKPNQPSSAEESTIEMEAAVNTIKIKLICLHLVQMKVTSSYLYVQS